ncbi:hypothetical protein J4456_01985 [Candidatus Pacearchaeota archaeon]|nr:hypothetical protein [Candidatus Pacearchaeota archaeon]
MTERPSHTVGQVHQPKQTLEVDKKIISESKKDKSEDKKIKDTPEKKEKKIKIEKNNKTEAIVNGYDLGISTKHAVALCNFIRDKNIDNALANLQKVMAFKRAVPMIGEIPHRRGNIMSGRYPITATKEFIRLLKNLRANALTQEMELEKYKLFCMANLASRPHKRFGQGRIKRSHVKIMLQVPGGKK